MIPQLGKSLAMAGAATMLTVIAAAANPVSRDEAPRCTDASHSVLVVQTGRDVCGATLLDSKPVSVGYLPTSCPDASTLVIDAKGSNDICRAPANAARPMGRAVRP